MKILFFVEPHRELSGDFRLGALQGHFAEIYHLKEFMPDIDCRIVVGEDLWEAANKQLVDIIPQFNIGMIRSSDLKDVFRDYKQAASAWYGKTYSDSQLVQMASLVKQALPGFVPDLVITHETQGDFLNKAYPKALVLHHMFGLSYRMPYPMLAQFDPQGLYANAMIATEAEKIRKDTTLSDADRSLLGVIRGWFAAQIVPHDPVWRHLEQHQSCYDKLILLPLQVDGYYAFEDCCPYSSQVEYLEAVMAKVPSNWGVVVTEHGAYGSSLDDLTISRLQRAHHNMIFIPELKEIPFCSQAVLPHVDAVISVSSSVACQALFFDIPVVSAGTTHINALATCDLDNVKSVFDLYNPSQNDEMLYFYLTRYNVCRFAWVEDGANFYKFLSDYVLRHQEGLTGLDLLPEPRDLDAVFCEIKGQSQWKLWVNTLKEKDIQVEPHPVLTPILFADAVSYDLFDTLVNRPFVDPHELFGFIEPIIRRELKNIYLPFHHLRREAERMAREFYGHRMEVTLDEIYDKLGVLTGLSPEKLNVVKQIELDAETLMIYPREGMKRVWRLTRAWGRPRTIITDIYLEEPAIQAVLEKNGFDGYDMLYVSATERQRKEDGTIYPVYVADVRNKFPGSVKLLHIGDNPRADGEMARRHGLTACVIPKAIDLMKKTGVAKLFGQGLATRNPNSSFLIGAVTNRFFSAPQSFHDVDSATGGSLYKFGYLALGPFVVGYTQWLMRRLKALKSDKAYFLARDAYLVMKAYEALRPLYDENLPAPQYLYCSRRSTVVPAMDNEDSIFELASLNFGTTKFKDFLDSRFGLNAEDLPPAILKKHGIKSDGSTLISYPRDLPMVKRVLSDILPMVYGQAEAEKSTYLAYLESIGATDKNANLAMIDIGYSGTMQRKISELTGCSYQGLYVFTHNYVLHHFQEEVFEAWLADYDDQRNVYRHPANNYIPFLESLLSSEEGSLVKFDLTGNGELDKILLCASNERDRINFVRTVHAGAMAFVNDFKDIMGPFIKDIELSPALASFPMMEFSSNPMLNDVRAFEGIILENLFAGAEFNVIANPKPYLNSDGFLAKATYERLVNESKWKEGARVSLARYLEFDRPIDGWDDVAGAGSSAKSYSLSSRERKMRKLRNDPYRYFADARLAPLRVLRHLFGKNTVGNAARKVVGSLV